ncbi:MAG: NAD(P)H-dependent oxidoreductase [Actinomycetia bacterium]|nr:NAD(P)H-dependent oxidoreductase [Actinomycetes bacterium]
MSEEKPDILFISASPRRKTSVALVGLLEQGAQKAGARTQHFFLSEKHIDPCTGCGYCEKTGICVLTKRTQDGHFADDYLELTAVLERVGALGIVAPVYFAGPCSQFKALMDRFQPYYSQRYVLGQKPLPKRPAHLYVVGGGDAHGFAPLAGIVRSAFNVAGFSLEKVHDFIGFEAAREAAKLSKEDDIEQCQPAQLVQMRRAAAQKQEFEERALSAGGAFARYVVKQQEADALSAQLEELKAELEVLKSVGDEPRKESPAERAPVLGARDEIEFEYFNLIHNKGKGAAVPVDVDSAAAAAAIDEGDVG